MHAFLEEAMTETGLGHGHRERYYLWYVWASRR
jgi:hypothetical protein